MGADYRHWIQKRNLNADYLGDFTYRNDLINQNGSSTGFIPVPEGVPRLPAAQAIRLLIFSSATTKVWVSSCRDRSVRPVRAEI